MRFGKPDPPPVAPGTAVAENGRSVQVEIFIFARFQARPGHHAAVEEAVLEGLAATREEPGCRGIRAFRSTQEHGPVFIHSHWRDEAAFDHHAGLPHTQRFLERVEPLLDHPLDIIRTQPLGREF